MPAVGELGRLALYLEGEGRERRKILRDLILMLLVAGGSRSFAYDAQYSRVGGVSASRR